MQNYTALILYKSIQLDLILVHYELLRYEQKINMYSPNVNLLNLKTSLETHKHLNLIIIMLGTNDLKSRFDYMLKGSVKKSKEYEKFAEAVTIKVIDIIS